VKSASDIQSAERGYFSPAVQVPTPAPAELIRPNAYVCLPMYYSISLEISDSAACAAVPPRRFSAGQCLFHVLYVNLYTATTTAHIPPLFLSSLFPPHLYLSYLPHEGNDRLSVKLLIVLELCVIPQMMVMGTRGHVAKRVQSECKACPRGRCDGKTRPFNDFAQVVRAGHVLE
jgi:hypothetical protein